MATPLGDRTDPTSRAIRALALTECARFRNRRMRARGRGRAVHEVRLVDWLAGEQLPMPACRQPVASPALVGALEPSSSEVTCKRCLGYTSVRDTAQPVHPVNPDQLQLVDLDVERRRRR